MSRSKTLSLTQIKAFCALAQYKSFKVAAKRLGVSQPALVNQIAELEKLYKTKLFYRQRGNNRLTNIGLAILPYCKSTLQSIQETQLILLAHGQVQTGELHIAAVSPYRVSLLIKKFNVLHPNIKIKVTFTASEHAKQLVSSGEVDAAFCVQEDNIPGRQSFFFYEYELITLLHRDHPLAERDYLQLQDFDNQNFISREPGSLTRQMFADALLEGNVNVNLFLELGSRESIREAVAQGLGISVVAEDEHVPHRNIVTKHIRNANLRASSSLVVLNDRVSSPLLKALIETVQQGVPLENGL